MNPAKILLIGGLALVALFTFEAYGPVLFPAISIATIGCILAGFMLFPRLEVKVPLVLNPLAPDEPFEDAQQARDYERSITLNGSTLPISSFPRRMTLSITIKNKSILVGMLVGSAVYAALLFRAGSSLIHFTEPDSGLFYGEFAVGYLTALMLLLSTKWLKERRILRSANVTIGTRSNVNAWGPRPRRVQHRFRKTSRGPAHNGALRFRQSRPEQTRLQLLLSQD
jgi:hypothetical protein